MHRAIPLAWMVVLLAIACGHSQSFDFTRPEDCRQWHPTHDVASLTHTPNGLVVAISGDDPYITGPAHDYTTGQLLWMNVRLRSEQDGMAQVFYFDRAPAEERSVHFPVRAGRWEEVRLPMPALGPNYRLRFDPPGTSGRVTLSRIAFTKRVSLHVPTWRAPSFASPDNSWPSIRSGDVSLLHGPRLGDIVVRVGNKVMARGWTGPAIGYVQDEQKWIDLSGAKPSVVVDRDAIVVTASIADNDGGTWRIEQRFVPAAASGAFDVNVTARVDRQREVAFLPLLVLFPGAGSFGSTKAQALFPGLEYLDKDEPSSSEADIIGPGSRRQVPDSLKITIPLMVVAADNAYIGLAWQPQPAIAAVFDSPDRLFNSGAHAIGLIYPGSNGGDRSEGSLVPHGPALLEPNAPLILRSTILSGAGTTAVAAVQRYVAMRGLPALPKTRFDLQSYARLAAAGWLDSDICDNNHYRHATPGNFGPQPAADAAWMMQWLVLATSDTALAGRLRDRARGAISAVAPQAYNGSGVAHVRYPVGSLYYGHVRENVAAARAHAKALLSGFETDGSLVYRPGKVDYGKTHFAKEANGLTAQAVATLLEQIAVCGDDKLLKDALRLLGALDKFMGSAPRGAQTWECPLHTPDILASAHLVKAYVLGFELTGNRHWLESAQYWAWTGVPFVYLTNPVEGAEAGGAAEPPVGVYSTIAVYGATGWVAPNWMGLPVQWCGLVYADALYRLHRYDPSGPWKQLADGIVISGMQQTFPIGSGSRNGLLPDSYVLRPGVRQNPAINPGTVLAPATHYFNRLVYDFVPFRSSGLLVHAPGRVAVSEDTPRAIGFTIGGCIAPECRVLVSACKIRPNVEVNGAAVDCDWLADERCAVITIPGDSAVTLRLP